MKNSVISLVLLLGATACLPTHTYQPFETTVTVVDMNNKPIKGQDVKVFLRTQQFMGSILNDEQTHAFGVTDANGQVVLRYQLEITDGTQQFATVNATDDVAFKSVNVFTHGSIGRATDVVKQTTSIQMDSIVPFTMRFKTDRMDVSGMSITVVSGFSTQPTSKMTTINRSFLGNFFQTRSPKLDTLITAQVYSKATFSLNNTMFFTNNPSSVSKGAVMIDKSVDRKSIYIQTF